MGLPFISGRMGRGGTLASATGGGGVTPFTNQYSVSFDGTNDYMIAGLDGTASGGVLASTDADINLTISMWLKPLASGEQHLFQWANTLSAGNPFITFTTTRVYVNGNFRHTFQTGEINTNAWNNFILTRTASDNTWRGYVAGNSSPIFTYSDGGSTANRTNASAIYLANQYFGYGNTLIDEVAVWNTNQDSNVSTIYNSGVPADISTLSPVGWWRMGDGTEAGSGTTVYDMSSNSNNGTLTNGPTFSTDVPS